MDSIARVESSQRTWQKFTETSTSNTAPVVVRSTCATGVLVQPRVATIIRQVGFAIAVEVISLTLSLTLATTLMSRS